MEGEEQRERGAGGVGDVKGGGTGGAARTGGAGGGSTEASKRRKKRCALIASALAPTAEGTMLHMLLFPHA